jgi:hypothetical protein
MPPTQDRCFLNLKPQFSHAHPRVLVYVLHFEGCGVSSFLLQIFFASRSGLPSSHWDVFWGLIPTNFLCMAKVGYRSEGWSHCCSTEPPTFRTNYIEWQLLHNKEACYSGMVRMLSWFPENFLSPVLNIA